MAAIVTSLASSFISYASSSSTAYSSLLRTKVKVSPCHRLAFAVKPRRGNLMAHTLVKATLGLTQAVSVDFPKISFAAKDIDLVEWKGDILAVGVTEKDMSKDGDSKFENPVLKKLDTLLGGLLSEVTLEEDFTGKSGQSTVLRVPGFGSKRVGLIGLGQCKNISLAVPYRSLGEAVASAAKTAHASSVAVVLASYDALSSESKLTTASAIASGTVLGIYEDNRFKSESKKPALKSVDILGLGTGPELDKKLKFAEDVCSGVILGKELVNAPPNVLTPGVLAEEASNIASLYSDVFTVKILDVEQCKELKMGSYLGVAAASANPPHFIHLCYKPPTGPVKAKLGLVGKGLTFDSGGYNIKTGPGCLIELMKFDMGGSAAVLGAAKAIGQIKPSGVEVHFVVAACENMISGTGMRPGDIVTAANGKTIEVNNTDAEGRLTLADALIYTCNQGVEKILHILYIAQREKDQAEIHRQREEIETLKFMIGTPEAPGEVVRAAVEAAENALIDKLAEMNEKLIVDSFNQCKIKTHDLYPTLDLSSLQYEEDWEPTTQADAEGGDDEDEESSAASSFEDGSDDDTNPPRV